MTLELPTNRAELCALLKELHEQIEESLSAEEFRAYVDILKATS
jgi:hypothetical protein